MGKIPTEVWVKIATYFTEQEANTANQNYIQGFKFYGYCLTAWLQRANVGIHFENIFYLWKGQENFTTVFKDTFFDPFKTSVSRGEEVTYFIALIFKQS